MDKLREHQWVLWVLGIPLAIWIGFYYGGWYLAWLWFHFFPAA